MVKLTSYDKETIASWLSSEKDAIDEIKDTYNQALKDINQNIANLESRIEQENYLWISGIEVPEHSAVYQLQYQEELKREVEAILDAMNKKNIETLDAYLNECYTDGFIGAEYSMYKQDVPMYFPIDTDAVAKAIYTDSKLSEGYAIALGTTTNEVKKKIAKEIARSEIMGLSYEQMAINIQSLTGFGYKRALTIARTEGNRITETARHDCFLKAKEQGAEVVKQWVATLDNRTRPRHVSMDGEIRELEELFSNGLMHPLDPNGPASEVVNCRCKEVQRVSYALDESDYNDMVERARFYEETYEISKEDSLEEFKEKWMKIGI